MPVTALLKIVIAHEDITERKQAENVMLQQERMNALGQMSCGIAHDFNNALATIKGFSELLLINPEFMQDEKRVQRYLELIHTAAKDGASVVSRLRDFYKHRDETERFQSIKLAKLAQEIISLTEPKWKSQKQAKGHQISLETDLQDVPEIKGDESKLREILINLVFNAVDAIPSNGTHYSKDQKR